MIDSKGAMFEAPIQPDGSYAMHPLAPGKVLVGVKSPSAREEEVRISRTSRTPPPKPGPQSPTNPPGWVPLPAKLAVPDTSGVAFEAPAGPFRHDIVLPD